MNEKLTILLVEDEMDLRSMLRQFLIREGYHVIAAMNKEEALVWIGKRKFDFYILDIMLPQEDGYDIAREVRKEQQLAPILFLTALHQLDHKLKAFAAQGDDYLTKPFALKELRVRIQALIRRSQMHHENAVQELVVEGMSLNTGTGELKLEGNTSHLKPKERQVLEQLMLQEGKIVPRYMLLERVWNENSDKTKANLDVQLHSLRSLFKDNKYFELETVRGIGVRLVSKHNIH